MKDGLLRCGIVGLKLALVGLVMSIPASIAWLITAAALALLGIGGLGLGARIIQFMISCMVGGAGLLYFRRWITK